MYRRYERDLHLWYEKSNRKPLVIRGARQVGKSTLVRQFCKDKGLDLFEVNLEKHQALNSVFALKKPLSVLEAVEDILQRKIRPGKGNLLFLDEIQAAPEALACLRYFFEELNELPVLCAGSLLEFTLNDHQYSMPVGRIEYLHMGPMSFGEFLLAKKENFLLERLSTLIKFMPFTQELHARANQLLREYLFVGGMPEAVATLVREGIDATHPVQAQIVQTYQEDFLKYAKKAHLQKIQKVFQYAFSNPCQKVKYSSISQDDLSRDLKSNLQLLTQALVIHPVYHSACGGLPLSAGENQKVFKLLALDVGLVAHLQGLTWATFKNYGENEILTEGALAEQFVGQHLLDHRPSYNKPRLNYWLREGKADNAEVDFILQKDSSLLAIEVKAGAAGKIRSLHQWMLECKVKNKKAMRFNLSPGEETLVKHKYENRNLKYKLLTLPLYMIDHWDRFF